jgi:hypothetical protein
MSNEDNLHLLSYIGGEAPCTNVLEAKPLVLKYVGDEATALVPNLLETQYSVSIPVSFLNFRNHYNFFMVRKYNAKHQQINK